MQARWLESWRKSKLSLREAVLDPHKGTRLRLSCGGVVLLIAGEVTLLIYYLMAVGVRMNQHLENIGRVKKGAQPGSVESFKNVTLLLCIVSGLIAFGVLGCYSYISANKSFFFILMCVARGILMLLLQVIVFIPTMLIAEQLDCDCIGGSEIYFWMNLLGSVSIIIGMWRFCDGCTRQPAITGEDNSSPNGRSSERRSNTIPVVYLLVSCRRVIEGVSLIISSSGVRDNLNGVAKDDWMDTLVVVLLCYGIGTILTFMMLVAKGCPTALERQSPRHEKIRRTFWNLAAPTALALLRFFAVIFLLQIIRWYDNSKYYPTNHIPTSNVLYWGFAAVACIAVIGLGLAGFLVRPSFFSECASVIERDITISIEADLANDGHSTLSRRSVPML